VPNIKDKEVRLKEGTRPRTYIPKPLYNNPTVVRPEQEHDSCDLERIQTAAMQEKTAIEIALKSEIILAALAFHDEMIERNKPLELRREMIPRQDNLAIQYTLGGAFAHTADISQVLLELATSGTRGNWSFEAYK
jgi:hypothetical protein